MEGRSNGVISENFGRLGSCILDQYDGMQGKIFHKQFAVDQSPGEKGLNKHLIFLML